jgi:hypothetical protein
LHFKCDIVLMFLFEILGQFHRFFLRMVVSGLVSFDPDRFDGL